MPVPGTRRSQRSVLRVTGAAVPFREGLRLGLGRESRESGSPGRPRSRIRVKRRASE